MSWVYIKNIVSNFSLLKTVFFTLYKMVVNEYSMGIYKSAKLYIEAVMRNSKMLKFVPDHLKTKKCVSMQLKTYLIF